MDEDYTHGQTCEEGNHVTTITTALPTERNSTARDLYEVFRLDDWGSTAGLGFRLANPSHGDTTASGGVDGSDPGPCGHDPLVVRDAEGATAVEADPTPPKPWLLQASPT